jgi:hypothetical protein
MDEHEPQKRLDLNDESGLTRREVLRRGAIVGGTLLWVAPAIQSISQKAFAAGPEASGGQCAACYCYDFKNHPVAKDIEVVRDKGKTDLLANLSSADCDAFCTGFANHSYCFGTKISGCRQEEFGGVRFPYDPDEAGALSNLLDAAIGCV